MNDVVDALRAADRIALVSHRDPDPDTIEFCLVQRVLPIITYIKAKKPEIVITARPSLQAVVKNQDMEARIRTPPK